MANVDLDRALNKITVDCLILIVLILPCLIIYGTHEEHGDSNAGSMYGLYIFPAIPLIIISLVVVAISRFYFKPEKRWLSSLTPLIFMVSAIWLDKNWVEILLIVVFITIIYIAFKPMVLRLIR
jgi:nicotinamide riboside transporter PnuC